MEAALAMVRHGIRHVVVTRDGRLRGVVHEPFDPGLHPRSAVRADVDVDEAGHP